MYAPVSSDSIRSDDGASHIFHPIAIWPTWNNEIWTQKNIGIEKLSTEIPSILMKLFTMEICVFSTDYIHMEYHFKNNIRIEDIVIHSNIYM